MFLLRSYLNRSTLGILFTFTVIACSTKDDAPPAAADPDAGTSETSAPSSSLPATSSAPSTVTPDAGSSEEPSSSLDDAGSNEPTSSPDAASPTEEVDSGTNEPTTSAPTSGDSSETSDGGAPDPWAGCPVATTPQNEAWPVRLRATEGAVYCSMFNENRTLVEELAAKTQLRFAPGVHHVPDVDTAALALPACIRTATEVTSVVSGTMTALKSSSEANTTYSLGFNQALGDDDPRRLQLRLEQSFASEASVEFVLDGVENAGLESYQSMDLCEVDGEYCFPNIIFTSCSYQSGELNAHTVEFDGGQVTFDLRIGDSFAGTEPGAFVAARGTYLEESFTQEDYFKLVYHPAHHHFERAFVVLFDEPRGDVCGIEVSGLEPFGDDVPDTAFTVDCDLDHLDELGVTSHTLVRGAQ